MLRFRYIDYLSKNIFLGFGDSPDPQKRGQIFLSIFQEKGLIIILRPKWGKLGEKWACGIIYKSKYAKNEIWVPPPPLNTKDCPSVSVYHSNKGF